MPEQDTKQTNKDRLKDITDSIEAGIKELFESDKYRQYLTTMSRFHRYSVNNQMLIYMQMPNATHVAGFNKWHDQFGRNVMKGQRGIKIIAPTPYKKKIEQEKIDPDTKLPVLDVEGKPVIEEKEIQIPMFKPVTVFDVSQTQGKPLPQLASDLQGNVQNYEVFMEALKRSAPVPVTIEPMSGNMDGYFDIEHQDIHVREGMSEIQTVSATVHEIAHSKLHDHKKNELLDSKEEYQGIEILDHKAVFTNGRVDRSKLPEGLYCYDLRGSDDDPGELRYLEENVLVNHAGSIITAEPIELPENGRIDIYDEMGFDGNHLTLREYYEGAYPEKAQKSRNTEEVEAESISFAVCAYYGIATGENSFGYIASWSEGKELKELKASLETINKTSSALITDIDRHYAEIMKERGLDKQEQAEAKEALYLLDEKQYLHIQFSEAGTWDYSFYDKDSMKLIDGGQLDNPELPLKSARDEIMKFHDLQVESITNYHSEKMVELLDKIEAANAVHIEPAKFETETVATYPAEETHLPYDVVIETLHVPESEPAAAPQKEVLPDPAISIETMNAYGYTDAEMLPLTKERALELAERDVTVYLLYSDNTEAMAFDNNEIIEHGGIFGVSREDWDRVKDNFKSVDYEKKFAESPADAYLIFQLGTTDTNAELRFMSTEYLERKGLQIDKANYDPIYVGELLYPGDINDKLNGLYETFNIAHPEDFKGHSLSISDIIVLKQDGKVSCHYVDTYGFKEIPNFLPPGEYLKNAEIALEDDYGMIDGIINNAPKQTEPEKKPSVLEKLRQPVPERTPKTTAHSKSAEMEM